MIPRETYDRIRGKLRDAKMKLSLEVDKGRPLEESVPIYEEAAFDAEMATIALLKEWCRDFGIPLKGQAFIDLRSFYAYICKCTPRLSGSAMRSDVGIVSSWHSNYELKVNLKSGMISATESIEAIKAMARIFSYIEKPYVEK